MNVGLVCHALGRLTMAYAAYMAIPGFFSLLWSEPVWRPFAVATVVTLAGGAIIARFGESGGRLGIREGFFIVTACWVGATLTGALPFVLSGAVPTYLDGVFETISGLTTTGASVIDDLESLPAGILLWRSMTHWLGGMGIIVLFIAVLPNMGVGAMHLFRAEVPGPTADRVSPRIHDTAVALWVIYVSMTAAQIALLVLAGMSFFDAVNHSFASLATGGFSTKNASIGHYNNLTYELIITFFMLAAGGNFGLYYLAWRKGPARIWRDTEMRLYLAIVAAGTLLIALLLVTSAGAVPGAALRDSLFQVASIITTTGFVSADFDKWPPAARIILFLLMFVGGCAGSTAGAIKVSRVLLLVKEAWAEIKRTIHPRAVISITVGGRTVEPVVLNTVAQFFFVYMLIFFLAVLAVAATGLEPFDAMGGVAATLGNVGPGFGVIGPTTNFSKVSPAAKGIFSLCMLLGRLELFTVLVLLRAEFWRSGRNW